MCILEARLLDGQHPDDRVVGQRHSRRRPRCVSVGGERSKSKLGIVIIDETMLNWAICVDKLASKTWNRVSRLSKASFRGERYGRAAHRNEPLLDKKIQYPIMIKASEGGGGKGIRKCNNEKEFRMNFRRVVVSGEATRQRVRGQQRPCCRLKCRVRNETQAESRFSEIEKCLYALFC